MVVRKAVNAAESVANELVDFVNKLNAAVLNRKILRTAISSVLAFHKPRIFEKGQDRTGAQIGTYGTKPISISKKNQARQTGQTFFKGGYSEYKQAIGKNPGYVNLRNTDQMMQDYGIVGDDGFGFQNKTNYDKSQWMQDKYDKDIFDLSDSELETLATVLEAQIMSALK